MNLNIMGMESTPQSNNERKEEVEALLVQEREYLDSRHKLLSSQENELQDWLDAHRAEGGVQLDDEAKKELESKKAGIDAIKYEVEETKGRIEKLSAERLGGMGSN